MRSHHPSLKRRLALAATGALLIGSVGVSTAAAKGPPGPGFYIDDVLYRTVGTPTNFFGTGAPASTYDKIYALGGDLMNVAESKPGDRDFNGGRWLVYEVVWLTISPTQFTNDGDILDAADAGDIRINPIPIKSFECPVIPFPGSKGHH